MTTKDYISDFVTKYPNV